MEFDTDGFGSFGGLVYESVNISDADIIIVGIPYESATSGNKGASYTPGNLRLLSADLQTISRRGINLENLVVCDVGNIPVFPLNGKKTRSSIEQYYSRLLNEATVPIVAIGGDHSCTYPIIKALTSQGTVGLVWIDAHRDILPRLLGSRFSHGSPLGRAIELDNVDSSNVLLLGTRYMQVDEQKIVDSLNLAEFRMVDLEDQNFDYKEVTTKITEISNRVDSLYVSIDIDVLDPAFASGTGTPVAGGMTSSQLMRLIEALPDNIRAIDLMEISPLTDPTPVTLKTAMGLLTEIFAKLSQR